MSPIRNINKAKLWKQVKHKGETKYVMAWAKDDPAATYFEGSADKLKDKGHVIHLETTFEDFKKSVQSSKASVSLGDLDRYIDFTKNFGMEG